MMADVMLRIAILLGFCFSATGLLFEAQPTTIDVGISTRLGVVCSFNHDTDYEFSSLVSLIISRARDDAGAVFNELASIDAFSGNVSNVPLGEGTVYGAINKLGVSYLRIEWKYPNDEVSGVYKCVANGVDGSGHPISVTSTSEVTSRIPDTKQLVQVVRNLVMNMDYTLENMCISGCWQSRLDQMMKARFDMSPEYNGHRYLVSKVANLASAPVAQESCEFYGGFLAEIDSEEEQLFVKNYINSLANKDYKLVLAGGTDAGHERQWVFERTGRNVTYAKWIPGYPLTAVANNCLYLHGDYDWAVFDYLCYDTVNKYNARYLCELPEYPVD